MRLKSLEPAAFPLVHRKGRRARHSSLALRGHTLSIEALGTLRQPSKWTLSPTLSFMLLLGDQAS